MNSARSGSPSPIQAAALAVLLIVLGFIGGYGYGFGIREKAPGGTNITPGGTNITPGGTPPSPLAPPQVKGLRASPDDKYVALTAVYDQSRQAARIVVDLRSAKSNEVQTPAGWQDYITQWSTDGKQVLFERERIPRVVAAATAGLYSTRMGAEQGEAPAPSEPELLTQSVDVPGEKIIAGFWTPGGHLVLKTQREPKSLYEIETGGSRLIDRAGVNFQQHRAVVENGKTVFYTVRDVPGDGGTAALFRVVNGKATRLAEELSGAIWVYLEDRAHYMTVCRQGEGGDWQWTVYSVTPRGAKMLTTARVPGDIGQVYWSPDGRRILGAGGRSLWVVDIPTLAAHQLTGRTDWNSDDACWLSKESAVLVAAKGELYKVALSGAVRKIWRFGEGYWR